MSFQIDKTTETNPRSKVSPRLDMIIELTETVTIEQVRTKFKIDAKPKGNVAEVILESSSHSNVIAHVAENASAEDLGMANVATTIAPTEKSAMEILLQRPSGERKTFELFIHHSSHLQENHVTAVKERDGNESIPGLAIESGNLLAASCEVEPPAQPATIFDVLIRAGLAMDFQSAASMLLTAFPSRELPAPSFMGKLALLFTGFRAYPF